MLIFTRWNNFDFCWGIMWSTVFHNLYILWTLATIHHKRFKFMTQNMFVLMTNMFVLNTRRLYLKCLHLNIYMDWCVCVVMFFFLVAHIHPIKQTLIPIPKTKIKTWHKNMTYRKHNIRTHKHTSNKININPHYQEQIVNIK